MIKKVTHNNDATLSLLCAKRDKLQNDSPFY